MYCNASDDDLTAVYAYLRTIKPVTNHVPDYEPPLPRPRPMRGNGTVAASEYGTNGIPSRGVPGNRNVMVVDRSSVVTPAISR
jgi:hypothetical protein